MNGPIIPVVENSGWYQNLSSGTSGVVSITLRGHMHVIIGVRGLFVLDDLHLVVDVVGVLDGESCVLGPHCTFL